MRVVPLAIWAWHGGKMKEEERMKNLASLVINTATLTHHDVLGICISFRFTFIYLYVRNIASFCPRLHAYEVADSFWCAKIDSFL